MHAATHYLFFIQLSYSLFPLSLTHPPTHTLARSPSIWLSLFRNPNIRLLVVKIIYPFQASFFKRDRGSSSSSDIEARSDWRVPHRAMMDRTQGGTNPILFIWNFLRDLFCFCDALCGAAAAVSEPLLLLSSSSSLLLLLLLLSLLFKLFSEGSERLLARFDLEALCFVFWKWSMIDWE